MAVNGRRLSIIFETMLKYPETYFRGMPDLVCWRMDCSSLVQLGIPDTAATAPAAAPAATTTTDVPDNDNNQGDDDVFELKPSNANVFAVEVKSANDSLSPWQMLWLELLVKARIPVEIFKLTEGTHADGAGKPQVISINLWYMYMCICVYL